MRDKRLRRFFVEEIRANGGFFSITGPEVKHMTRVMRMGPGDRFILMDGKGHRFLASIESAGPTKVHVALEKRLPTPSPSPVKIFLCQALLKSRPMDYMIQKTSELGVHCILPFSSERSIVRLGKERLANKIRHWREIAYSTAKQSDRSSPTEIEPPYSFKELMKRWKGRRALKLLLWEEEGSKDLKGLLRASSPVKNVVGIVGPEGGFGQAEVEAAKNRGFVPVSLGDRILRSETAAITLVAIIQYEWGDLSLSNVST